MENLVLYIRESYNELVHKVTWPTWPNLVSSTVVVLVASVMIALIIVLMDFVFNTTILRGIYKIKF